MLKIQVIKSNHSQVPLAEIRTDGKNIEWTVDNYELSSHFVTYPELLDHIKNSSTLSISDREGPTTTIRSFSLNTGDTLSVTSDGKTALLNGRLLNPVQKESMQNLISSGQVQPVGEAAQIPIIAKKKAPIPVSEGQDPLDLRDYWLKRAKEEADYKAKGSVYHDPWIEDNFKDDYDSPLAKNLMYLNKYGKLKGGVELI